MPPRITYELSVGFSKVKNPLNSKSETIALLQELGVNSFVEGFADNLNIDHPYENPDSQKALDEIEQQITPILVYSYTKDELANTHSYLANHASEALDFEINEIETTEWMEGWKTSFKPIESEFLFIHPPWIKPQPTNKHLPIEIDPGMAFGTGQHATTQLCIRELESIIKNNWLDLSSTILDVGTGTGILAIAANKLGFSKIDACDIEQDAVLATHANASANQCSFRVWKGSALEAKQQGKSYDLVIANILAVVIDKIFSDLSGCTNKSGYLLISGILEEQAQPIISKAEENGFKVVERVAKQDWVAILLKKMV